MNTEAISSAPGKMMICGEYAVLKGGSATAVAVDKRLEVRTRPSTDDSYRLISELWAAPIVKKKLDRESSCLLERVAAWAEQEWKLNPFKLVVTSNIKVSDGLGSSSALILATLASLQSLNGFDLDSNQVAKTSLKLQRDFQGFASGYDFATQTAGGIVVFTPQEQFGSYERLPLDPAKSSAFFMLKGGRGAPTKSVGKDTLNWLNEDKERWRNLLTSAEQAADTTRLHFSNNAAGKQEIGVDLIKALARLRDCFQGSPHYPKQLLDSFSQLPGFDQSWILKPCGAGGEDALMLVARNSAPLIEITAKSESLGWQLQKLPISARGLEINATDAEQMDRNL